MDDPGLRTLQAREAKRMARLKFALIFLAMAVLMDIAVAVAVLRGNAPPTDLTIIVLAIITAGLAVLVLALSPGADARRLGNSPGRRDREQSARTRQILSVTASSAVLSVIAVYCGRDVMQGGSDFPSLAMVMSFTIVVATLPAMIMGWDGAGRKAKRYIDDELTRSFRARAMITGFWVLLPGMIGLWLFGLWRPDQAVALMPLALWAGAAAACLRFGLLHRAAERDE